MTKEELEKEAKEYGKKATAWLEDREPLDQRDIENAYLAGAEPREKRIAELEEENKVLAQNLEDTEILNKTYEKRFDDLKNENAELKTKVTALENANRAMVKELDDTTSGGLNFLQNVVKNKEELTTAKEIISEYINILKGDTKNWKKTQEKAEQFIKEE